MAITRTTMVDDDGSGTTGTVLNNAWLQTIYNQIDAADAALVTYGTFTPTDASGAALVFAGGTAGKWAKHGKLVFVWFQVVYPATANAAAATIGGLPEFVRSPTGGSQGFGVHAVWNFTADSKTVSPINPTTAAAHTNANMSGRNMIVSGVYLTD